MQLFSAIYEEATVFKTLGELWYNIFGDIYLEVRDTGLYSRMMDVDQILMFDLALPKEAFKDYVCNESLIVEIGAQNFHDIVSSIRKKDQLQLQIVYTPISTGDKLLQLVLTILPKEGSYISENYITIHQTPPYLIDLPGEYRAPAVLAPSARFPRICKAVHKAGKEFVIDVGPQFIRFVAEIENIIKKRDVFGTVHSDDCFSDTFDSELFLKISKISSFHRVIKFYPNTPHLPLWIKLVKGMNEDGTFTAQDQGFLSIYLKSKSLISRERNDVEESAEGHSASYPLHLPIHSDFHPPTGAR